MTARDRLMLVGLAALAVLVGGWLLVVSPEKQQASKIAAEVAAARQKLAAAEAQAAEATKARARYASAYSSMVDLGQAVPATQETPALMYALDAATHVRHVLFSSITASGSGSGSSSPAPAVGAGAGAGAAAAASATFKQQPFTFVFDGNFEDLYKLFAQLESFTKETSSGTLQVNGRLLTIDSVQLAPGGGSSSGSSGGSGSGGSSASSSNGELTGTVTATAYVLPPGQTPLAGASPTAPAGAAPAAGAGGPTPTTTAVVKGAP